MFLLHWGQGKQSGAALVCVGFFFEKRGAEVPSLSVRFQTSSFLCFKGHPSRGFDGYVDKAATEKKICRDVLRRGDMWFRSGDLLTMDEFGWMYFVDRMGDTYR